jgi:UDP-N-acetyl-D-glucosamine/UDP-N-acetyl-D-galactosamine dehydrogenase
MNDTKIAIIGLGYVGLPLAAEFSKATKTFGFDINSLRVNQLIDGYDKTLEFTKQELTNLPLLNLTSNINDIKECNIFIITVPTPIDIDKKPDLRPLMNASKAIGGLLKLDDIVIYESTVYPGATEEVCVPILEAVSGLKFNEDFYCGYSPERISPGEKKYTLKNIVKVTSGSTPEVAEKIDLLYKSIIKAGTFKASSMRVAESAKVIENTQRDVNIALINELSIIFKKLNIDTKEVLEAAGTKWNFLNFRPGLVGGHCIGVDPYYLTYKALEIGHYPDIILAGRKINDNMGFYIAKEVVFLMTKKNIKIANSNILIMGLTFKENCPDVRNTKVVDLYSELNNLNAQVDIYDPWANHEEVKKVYNISTVKSLKENYYDAIILAVGHSDFVELGDKNIRRLGKKNHVLYDIKYVLPDGKSDARL